MTPGSKPQSERLSFVSSADSPLPRSEASRSCRIQAPSGRHHAAVRWEPKGRQIWVRPGQRTDGSQQTLSRPFTAASILLFLFLKIYFFFTHLKTFFSFLLEREEGRKTDAREKHRWVAPWTGYQTHSLGVRPDWESKPQPFGCRTTLQLSHTGQGCFFLLLDG